VKVKVFTASNIQDAMAQVKGDLGRDAVILHTRRFRRGGFLGFFGKEMVEVMAALDTPPPAPAAERRAVVPPPVAPPRPSDEDAKVTALQLEMSNMRKMVEQVLAKLPGQEKQRSPWYDLLVKNDIDPAIAENLVQGLPEEGR
jgi:flagellar biosynthesis protein FlhF